MKIQISHLKKTDFINEIYNPIKNSDLRKEHDFILPHETLDTKINSRETLKDVDLLIAEVSYPATWQGIELWFASLYQKPILCLYKKGHEIAGSLKYISNDIFEYSNTAEFLNLIKTKIDNLNK